MSQAEEIPVVFECEDEQLIGIIHEPSTIQNNKCGVLIVVGGPQYRVGSHRQFLLLARFLCSHGYPVMRFDYRGMGDSSGELRDFEGVNKDIRAAIDKFSENVPSIKKIVLWGLCDAASASMFYAPTDERVTGLVMLNPWVRTEQGEAKTFLKKYYFSRFMSREFWMKLLKGGINPFKVLSSMSETVKKAFIKNKETPGPKSLPERMLNGLTKYDGDAMLILSGNDLTAEEFKNLMDSSSDWKKAIENLNTTILHLKEANHTFSSIQWRNQVELWTLDWLKGK